MLKKRHAGSKMDFKSPAKKILLQKHINFLVIHGLRLLCRFRYHTILTNIIERVPVSADEVTSITIDGEDMRYYARGAIGRQIFWTKSYPDAVAISIFTHLARKSSVIMDIGANIGLFAISGAKANLNARVYAFEPIPSLSDAIEANKALNDLSNIWVIPQAVSNTTGVSSLYLTEDDTMASLKQGRGLTIEGERQVSTVTLDEFCESRNIEKVDLIKIDVEGAETFVLKGGTATLNSSSPYVIVEVLNAEVAYYLNHLLGNMGYRFFNITLSGIMPADTVEFSANLDNRNWLCVSNCREL
ncbi:MAG TPA: FkbM family methyltransferase [Syntrophorhabdaceae bacterium]|nr:FkbM family methyltransferase [Syntrophorhabdaceae bacterium]